MPTCATIPERGASLRLSYSSGFRAPQAFDEDMHIAIVGGERVRIRLADDLREERSHSLSLSADLYHRFGKVQTNLLVEGFYTTLDHVFALRPLPDPDTDGSTIKERYNGSGARVMGINIEGKAAFTRWFDLQAGITLQQSRCYREPEQWSEDPEVAPTRKMFRTPNTYGYLTAELTPVRNLQAAITGTYTGKMLVQHMAGFGQPVDRAVTTPRFFDLNLKVSYDVILYKGDRPATPCRHPKYLQRLPERLRPGANRDSGYIYGPSLPRSWFVGAKISFDGLPEAPAAPASPDREYRCRSSGSTAYGTFLKISLSESHDIFRYKPNGAAWRPPFTPWRPNAFRIHCIDLHEP